MQNTTIYLDEGELIHSKPLLYFQIALGGWILYRGIQGVTISPSSTHELADWIMLICGIVIVSTFIYLRIFPANHKRRPFLKVEAELLTVKPSLYAETHFLRWDEIASVEIKPNTVQIDLKNGENIKIEMPNYSVNQKVKETLNASPANALSAQA